MLKKKGAASQIEEVIDIPEEVALVEGEALPIRRRPLTGVPSGMFHFFEKPVAIKKSNNSILKKGQ